MEQSILISTKKILGVSPDDESFDLDIITHINSAFSNLHDVGVGPTAGFVIEGPDNNWADFLTDAVMLSKAKTYVYLYTKSIFDPPTSGYLLDALNENIKQALWRLNVNFEATGWSDPDPPTIPEEDPYVGTIPTGFDGGGA